MKLVFQALKRCIFCSFRFRESVLVVASLLQDRLDRHVQADEDALRQRGDEIAVLPWYPGLPLRSHALSDAFATFDTSFFEPAISYFLLLLFTKQHKF